MDLTTSLVIITLIYCWFYFIDRFLKSCSHYAYIQFLKNTGLDINFLRFNWTTNAFNRLLLKWGTKLQTFSLWFDFGLIISLILLPLSMGLLFVAFFQNIFPQLSSKGPIINPVLPGVDIPISELGYYSLTLLMCYIVHEMGHALAAVQEDVNILNTGVDVLFILPVAYVNLNSDKLFSLNPWKRLKILCAGVWHNLVLTLAAYLLFMCLPIVFSPLFHINSGVIITEITPKSPLTGPRGLNPLEIITKINDCPILNEDHWLDCLRNLQKPSFCIKADLIHNLDESIPLKRIENDITCCHKENVGKLCFEFLDLKDTILELPPFACLPARTVIETAPTLCNLPPHTCPKDTYCFKPLLVNHTNLFKIERRGKGAVIYIGTISDVFQTVKVSPFIPKYRFLSTKVPDVLSKFLEYVVLFSLGLAIINILPCLFMDGQRITDTVVYLFLANHLRKTHINVISAIITVFFTLILFVHCLLVVWKKVQL